MGDAYSDMNKMIRENEIWEEQTVPEIERTLLGKKPEDLSPEDNDKMYCYYRWLHDKKMVEAERQINMELNSKMREHFDASLGQGRFAK
jgi:hypothetical protein